MTDLKTYAKRALASLDLTNLNNDCTEQDIIDLCVKAQTAHGNVAAVCIWPQFIKQAKVLLKGTGVRIATVVNFPSGMESIASVRAMAAKAVEDGADEIDLVIPWPELLENRPEVISPTVASVKNEIGTARLKAILETGMLETEDNIRLASELAIEGGADFIKTSTGKVPINATPRAVGVMLEVLNTSDENVGLKPSGGIKTTQDAAHYLTMVDDVMGQGWATSETMRFGASGVLADILAVLGDEKAPEPVAGY
jgi:deoxyribose-phosphate aldolase